MTRGIFGLLAGLLVFGAAEGAGGAENAAPALDFHEVYDLIRQHLSGISEDQLNAKAAEALIDSLRPSVAIDNAPSQISSNAPLLSKAEVFEDGVAYLRVNRVADDLANAVKTNWTGFARTNRLVGLALDLRFSGGEDYQAAAKVADLFLKKERPLLDWGHGPVNSTEKLQAIDVPVAVLVNKVTSGSAEALAAVLRQTGAAIVIGTNTAGSAMISKDFPVKTGQRLKIAVASVKLGDGTALSSKGVQPDISVHVNPAEEKGYWADAFLVLPKTNLVASAASTATNQTTNTSRSRRSRFNEAELVRERREGVTIEDETPGRQETEPEQPLVHDPVLARALDVLKGLAVIRRSRS
jgi:Peptidase family S41